MVKGTSRQVIVVSGTEEKLFDQAIFILRDGAVEGGGVSDEALLKEARGCLEPPPGRKRSWLHTGPVWGAAGAGVTGVLWLLSAVL
ncbi:MAG: translation initiation factor 2 [Oscillospiraceae bacterium]|nr:translation initiation factor 2 [Oscillospiraceae bacterium]